MSFRFRGNLGPFVVDAPLTQKTKPQGALTRSDTLWLVGTLGLALLLCGGMLAWAL